MWFQKDYTPDINKVREDMVTALEEQNQALTEAINSLREEARQLAAAAEQTAKDYADAAAEAAEQAAIAEAENLAEAARQAAIEAAQKAADNALALAKEYADMVAAQKASEVKAEIIAEIQDDLKRTLEDAKAYTDAELKELEDALNLKINELASRIEGVAADFQKQLEDYADQFNGQLDQLEQDLLDQLGDLSDSLREELGNLEENFNGQLGNLEDDLNGQIGGLEDQIGGLRDSLYNQLNEIHSQVYEIMSNLNSLSSIVEAQGEQINGLIALTTQLEARIETLEAYKLTVDDFMKETEQTFNELNERLGGLDDRLDSMEEAHGQDIDALKSAIENTRSEMSEYVEDLQLQINAINTLVLNLQELYGEVSAEIAKLYGEIALLGNRVDGVENSLAAYQEAIDNYLEILRAELEAAIAAGDNATAQAVKEELINKLNESLEIVENRLREYFTTELSELENLFGMELAKVRSELSANYNELNSKIDELRKEMFVIEKAIYAYVNESINTLTEDIRDQFAAVNAKLGKRLTSITLIPETYVNGVPSVMIPVLTYNPYVEDEATPEVFAKDNKVTYYSSIDTIAVRYHLSPDHIDINGIVKNDINYVFEAAEMVKSYVASEDLDWFTIDYDEIVINDRNELVIPLLRNAIEMTEGETVDFRTTSDREIITGALKVPIAEALLTDEEKQNNGASVTSEYTAFYDDPRNIHITPLKDLNQDINGYSCENGHKRFSTTFYAVKSVSVLPSVEVRYDESIDLLSLVTSCAYAINDQARCKEISKETLKDHGFEFRFSIPAEYYKGTEKTNEQDFVQFVSGSTTSVEAKLPGGVTDNRASVGRTPVIRVELVNVDDNAIVDVQWFKIVWVDEEIEDVELGNIKTFDYLLSCNDFRGELTWQEFNDKVISKIGAAGMSHEEFGQKYVRNGKLNTTVVLDAEAENFNDVTGTIDIDYPVSEVELTTAILSWSLTVAEIGDVIDEILENGKVSKTIDVTIHPNGVGAPEVTFSLTMNVLPGDLPAINGYNDSKWSDANHTLAPVYPVAYAAKDGDDVTTEECYYYYSLMDLFRADGKGNIIKNLYISEAQAEAYGSETAFDCRAWDMQFSATQENTPDENYVAEFVNFDQDYAGFNDEKGYSFIYNYSAGREIDIAGLAPVGYPGAIANWYRGTEDSYLQNFYISVPSMQGSPYDPEVIAIVSDPEDAEKVTVTIDVWAQINLYNIMKVTSFDVWFVAPLTFSEPNVTKSITDAFGTEQSITLDEYLGQVKDFDGARVDKDEDMCEYYGLEYAWGAEETIRVNMKLEGDNLTVDTSLDPANPEDYEQMLTLEEARLADFVTLEDDGAGNTVLKYRRTAGTANVQTVTMYIPVTYTHIWGSELMYAAIELKPSGSIVD